MKRATSMLSVIGLALVLSTGCATFNGGGEQTAEDQLKSLEPWVEEAAFWGSWVYLQDNPGHKPGFIAAVAAIDAVTGEDIDYEYLMQVMREIGVDEGASNVPISAALSSVAALISSYEPQFADVGKSDELVMAKRMLVRVRNGMTRAVNMGDPKKMKLAKVPKK